MSRIGIFIYGIASYLVFFAVFLYGIGFIGGFLTPTTLDGPATEWVGRALLIDMGLLTAFVIQHSGMARTPFKQLWKHVVPEAAERSTYVLVSSLALGAMYIFWQPIGVWFGAYLRGPRVYALWGYICLGGRCCCTPRFSSITSICSA